MWAKRSLNPGASPGIAKAGKSTWKSGGTYEFEINDATGSAGTAFDLLSLKGALTVTATAANQFTIKLKTLTPANTPGAMANFDPTQSYFWPLVRSVEADPTQPVSGSSRFIGFEGDAFVIDRTGFANSTAGGRFSLSVTSTELRLAFVPNHPPVPLDDAYSMDQGDTLTRSRAQGLFANDIDADFSTVTLAPVTPPAHGTLALNTDGSFSYTPAAAFFGTDTFTYGSNDGALAGSRNATVTLTVHGRPANTVPGAQSTIRNTVLRFSAATAPLANAIRVADPDSTTLTVTLSVTHGTLSITTTAGLTLPNGATSANLVLTGSLANVNAALESLAYTPALNYTGSDTLTLVTTDEGGRTNRGSGSVALIVAPPIAINSAVATNGTYKTPFAFSVTTTEPAASFSATGLPAGLSIHPTSGEISGSATVSGIFNATLTATDSLGFSTTGVLALNIAKRGVTVTGLAALSRIYDGSTVATLNVSAVVLNGIATGDAITLNAAAAVSSFASRTVGSAKPVTITGLALAGAASAHYTLTTPAAAADITAKPLAVTGIAAISRAYNGSTAAALNLSAPALNGVVGSDAVQLVTTGAAANFATASAGSAKPVTVTGLALAGADATNYALVPLALAADITPQPVSIAIGNLAHVYDGTAKQATVTASPNVSFGITYSASPVINAGSYTVIANVNDANYSGSSVATLTIAKAAQTVTLTAPATATLASAVAVSAAASSGLPVTLAVSGPATLSGGQLAFNAPGTATLTATQAGNENYTAATATASVTAAGKLAQTIAFGAPTDRLSSSGSFALNATATSGLPVAFAVLSGPAMLNGDTVTLTGTAGRVVVRASQPGNAIYDAAPEVSVSFNITAATLNVFFGAVSSGGSTAKSGDIAAALPPNSNRGSLLVVAPGVGVNTVLDFTLSPDGTFTQTVVIDVPGTGASGSDTPARAAAPITCTIRGTLINGRLSGTIEPLGLAFSANVLPVTGSSANAAGFYKSSTLANTNGATYSVVGTNNEVLVLAKTPDVTAGGLTTLNANGTFALTTATSAGMATISGAVDEPTTTVAGTIKLLGKPDTSFAGLVVTTVRTDRLVNLSSRVRISAADPVLITGFVIGGSESKQVLVRGIGPALTGFGIQGVLANPRIRIYRGSEIVAENDNWSTTADAGALAATFSRLGAFALANNSADAALVITLPPGAYTAQVSDIGGTGVALAEIYDASMNPNSDYQRLVNISTRGEAGTGENILIGGFVVTATRPRNSSCAASAPASRPSVSAARSPTRVSVSSAAPRSWPKTTTGRPAPSRRLRTSSRPPATPARSRWSAAAATPL